MMRRTASLALICALAVGCGATATTQRPTEAPTATTEGPPPVVVAGQNATGATAPFQLAAGSYHVAWATTADNAGCTFYLYLSTTVGGATVKDVPTQVLPAARDYSGEADWSGVAAGTYVLQEDRSGTLSCAGSWNATLTTQ